MFQLLMRIPERPGAQPAPWAHGVIGTAAEVWECMMTARAAGLVCRTQRTTQSVSTQMDTHDLFVDKVDLGGLV